LHPGTVKYLPRLPAVISVVHKLSLPRSVKRNSEYHHCQVPKHSPSSPVVPSRLLLVCGVRKAVRHGSLPVGPTWGSRVSAVPYHLSLWIRHHPGPGRNEDSASARHASHLPRRRRHGTTPFRVKNSKIYDLKNKNISDLIFCCCNSIHWEPRSLATRQLSLMALTTRTCL
jgi:hypothetical protein